ncbi:MlaD family protein [Siccirubricoccus phaeus]|uniref:MlaD family protein n=1 Tax=Siccirubricoccus phaeus TaxID=2595053 RepID=UPI0011F0AEC8|nr:MlaD family protein [Siccirubricoccus phaeus]
MNRSLYFRVGALVLAGAGLLIGFVLFFTANRFGTSTTVYETYIRESVQGLEVGAPVRYRGVRIGRISEIGLVSSEYRRPQGDSFGAAFQLVFVRFLVDSSRIGETPNIEEAVKQGLRVRMASQGITGVNYLEVDFVEPERYPPRQVPWAPRNPYIPAIPSTVAQVQTAAEDLLARLRDADLPGKLSGLVEALEGQLKDGDLAQTLREASALLKSLRETTERADLPGTTAELRGVAGDARALLGAPELRRSLANLEAVSAEARRVVGRLPGTLNSVDATLRGARSTTTDVQAELAPILRDLRAAVSNLRDTTEQLRRSPSQLLLGAPPPAPEARR